MARNYNIPCGLGSCNSAEHRSESSPSYITFGPTAPVTESRRHEDSSSDFRMVHGLDRPKQGNLPMIYQLFYKTD